MPIQFSEHPRPPDDLINACLSGECVLYAGAGLSAQAGLPVWHEFLEELLNWSVKIGAIPSNFAESLHAALEKGRQDAVADNIVSALEPQMLYDHLSEIFLRPLILPHTHSLISSIPFSALLTTNFDNLLEEAYASKGSMPRYTPRDSEPLLDAIHKREFFLLKLYGALEQPDTLMIASAQFEEIIRRNAPFSRFMETLFISRTILFLGASLEGIEDYLKGLSFSRSYNPRQHYALVEVSGRDWEVTASVLTKRFGINVIPYSPQPGYPELLEFLNELCEKTNPDEAAHHEAGLKGIRAEGSPPVSRLKKLTLENIGPFSHLELPLESNWNILLGDNGVGKSTILRAIAVAICGKDAQNYAGRLIKSGATDGQIILQTDRATYKTELKSQSSGIADIESIPARPFEAEGWLAVGVPPLRTVSWERPRSPEAEVKGRPTTDDLLPLVTGSPDPRLDKLKQWLVNLDYWIKDSRTRTGSGGRYEKLLAEFFKIVGDLTEGLSITFKEVKAQTNEVTVITDDGELPIEAVSQGTTSLIGWVGILLQRLYEIYGDEAKPTSRYALVLIDEIDAHMHPAWQQAIVSKLTRIFPEVQFVATTHSPLIIGGMPASQIKRFVRNDDGVVEEIEVADEMIVGRADQILTSELFGLHSTLDLTTQEYLEEYKKLLGKRRRSAPDERKFIELHGILKSRIPMSAESASDRRIQEQQRKELLEKVRKMSVDINVSHKPAIKGVKKR